MNGNICYLQLARVFARRAQGNSHFVRQGVDLGPGPRSEIIRVDAAPDASGLHLNGAPALDAPDTHPACGRRDPEVLYAIMSARNRFRGEIAATLALIVVVLLVPLTVPLAQAAGMPQALSQGSVDYVSGGVSKEESDWMKQASADYPLTVEFVSSGPLPTDEGSAGYYIAGALVDIRDSQGVSILSTKAEGPFLLVRLPTGRYTINTEWNGVRKERTVELTGKTRQHVVFDYARGAQ